MVRNLICGLVVRHLLGRRPTNGPSSSELQLPPDFLSKDIE